MTNKLSSRERVIKALNHKEPDRVPLDIGAGPTTSIVMEGYEKLKDHLNIDEESVLLEMDQNFRLAKISNKIMSILGSDCYPIGINLPVNFKPVKISKDSFIDIWGITYKKVFYNNGSCFYYELQKSPLAEATIEDLKNYNWPDPYDEGYTMGLEDEVKDLFDNTQYAIVGGADLKNLWGSSFMLRGYENLLMDVAINQKFFISLMEILLEINMIVTGRFLDITGKHLQVFRTAGDMATQNGLLLAPEAFRKLIKPFYKEYFEFIKSKTDAKIFYHSCGNITGLLDDLIDVGVDIINPVQVSAMGDMKKIKKRFGKDLVFWGGIDTQDILPNGSVCDVEDEVRERIKEMAHEGGYVLAAVHNIQPDVPAENIIAMANASRKFGIYPLNS